jgi:hypothetical protein
MALLGARYSSGAIMGLRKNARLESRAPSDEVV